VGYEIESRERFELIYAQYEQRVLAYALRRAAVEVAKDAVAETFLTAWRRFEESPADPLPWLIAATRRTLANQRRSIGRQVLLAERLAQERQPDPGGEGVDAGDAELVRAAFATLTVEEREVLALIAWDGLTAAQAARSLRCTAVAYRVRLHRARRRLADALHELDDPAGDPTPSVSEQRPTLGQELPR